MGAKGIVMTNRDLETIKKLIPSPTAQTKEELNPPTDSSEKSKRNISWWLSKIASVAGLLYLLFVIIGPAPTPPQTNKIGNTEIIIFCLILLFNSGLLDNVEDFSISGTGIAFKKLKKEVQDDINKFQDEQIAELNKQQKRIDLLQEQQTANVKFLVKYLVDGNELMQLSRLNSEEEVLGFDYSDDFARELKRLRALGFINNYAGRGLRKLKEDGHGNLRKYFHITEEGKAYLSLRESLGITQIPGIGSDGRWYSDIRDATQSSISLEDVSKA